MDPRTVYLKRQINDILKNKWENYKNFQRYLILWKDIYKKTSKYIKHEKNINHRWLWIYRFQSSYFFKEKNIKFIPWIIYQEKESSLNFKRLKKFKIRNYRIDITNAEKVSKLPKFDIILDCCALVEATSKKKILKTFFP